MDREKVINGLECCDNDDCDNCSYFRSNDENDLGTCKATLHRDAIALLKLQEPRTAEVKWQERHRKSYRQYTGFDAMGDEHTVTVCEESEGREPYCGKCSAQLAESFINYCPRCGVKLIIPSPTDAQREATPWNAQK